MPTAAPTLTAIEPTPGYCGELCNYEFWQEGDVSVEDVRAELARGADVNTRDGSGYTPLLTAVYVDAPPEIIRLLLDHGADADAKDADGTSILAYALINARSPEVIRGLLEAGADANAKNEHGTPVLHEAVRLAAYLSHPETVRAASEAGLDLAAYRIEIIESLLEHGADASVKDGSGQSVLFVYFAKIIESGSEDNCRSVRFPCPAPRVVELLLEYGAEVQGTLEDHTEQVMGYALWAGAGAEIIALLLEHGADAAVGGGDEDGTLLHVAALFSADPQVFKLLLDNGADVTARGSFGRTALHLVSPCRHP